MTTASPAAPATATSPATAAVATTPSSTSAAMAAPPAATPAAPAAPSTETVNPGAWQAGFNDDLKGYIGLKGFKDPGQLADAYRSLEKLQGVPQDRLMKLPEQFYDEKGLLTPGGREIYERLGAPKDAKDYGIDAPKEGGDPARLQNFLKTALDLGLTKAQAQKLAASDGEYSSGFTAAMQEKSAAEFRNQQQALAKDWGAASEQNTRIAADAVRQLGWDSKKIDAVSAAIGHAETMKLLCNLGKAVGESAFIGGQRAAGPLEPATAQTRIRELQADRDFGAKLMNGDAEAKATWQRLHEQAYQGTVNV